MCSAVNAGGVWGMSAGREAGATDALGAFGVDRVPRGGVKLEITGPARPRVRVDLDQVDDPLHIEVVVPFLGHLQVALAVAPPARGRIELRDDAESAVQFHVVAIGSIWTGDRIDVGNPDEFAGGQTPVLSVPESVRAAVLLDADGNELRRVAVTPGDELVRVVL
jgi:hypothetical protein